MRGDDLPPLHGLPIGIKDLEDTAGLRTTYGSPLFRDHVPDRDQRLVARVRAAGAHRARQDQHAGIGRRREYPQRRLRRDRQSVRSRHARRPARRAARRWRWPPAWCRSAPAPIPAARCATRPRSAASSASARRRAWCRTRSARSAGPTCRCSGPMARTVPDVCLLLSAMVGDDARDPLATTVHGRAGARAPRISPCRRRSISSRLRVAVTPDFGFAPTERAHRRGVRREDRPVPPRVRRAPRTPRRIAPAPTRRSRCCARSASSPATARRCARRPAGCRPERPRQCRGGAALHRRRRRARAGAADRAVSALAGVLRATTT